MYGRKDKITTGASPISAQSKISTVSVKRSRNSLVKCSNQQREEKGKVEVAGKFKKE
jgi:hypothetical protein